MLKRLFGFLHKEEKKIVRELEFSKIDKYLGFILRDKTGALNRAVKDTSTFIQEKKKEALQHLKDFHQRDLMNANIPVREIQIMEGNREHYVTRMHRFVHKIEIPQDYLELYAYCIKFSQELEQVGKELQKSIFVLKYFYEDDIKIMNRIISDMEDNIIKIRIQFEKQDIKTFRDVQEKMREIMDNKAKIRKFQEHAQEEQAEIDQNKEKHDKLTNRIEKIKASTEYQALENFRIDKEEAMHAIKKTVDEFSQQFSEIEPALRKYYYLNPDKKILQEYFKDIEQGLFADKKQELVGIVHDVREMIINEAIVLKDKKKENALEATEIFTTNYMTDTQETLNRLQEAKENAQAKITHNTASLNLSEQQYWLRSIDEKNELHEKAINKFTHEITFIEGTNQELLQEIELAVRALSGEDIRILSDA